MVRAGSLLGAENDLIKYWVSRSMCWLIIQPLRGWSFWVGPGVIKISTPFGVLRPVILNLSPEGISSSGTSVQPRFARREHPLFEWGLRDWRALFALCLGLAPDQGSAAARGYFVSRVLLAVGLPVGFLLLAASRSLPDRQ